MLTLAVTDAQKVSYCRALHQAKPLHSESGSGKSDPDSPAHHDESPTNAFSLWGRAGGLPGRRGSGSGASNGPALSDRTRGTNCQAQRNK